MKNATPLFASVEAKKNYNKLYIIIYIYIYETKILIRNIYAIKSKILLRIRVI